MNANERFEELASQFKQDTGLLAPGKDAPAAVAADPEYDQEYRRQEWEKWLKKRQEEAEKVYRLLERGWIPPEEAKNYVGLAKDQRLPSVRNAVNKSYNDYMLGMEDMWKAGFRKVEV